MNRYVALLRGINVGGHHVRIDDLKARFEELGLQNVRTYIQSGNVFFRSAEPDARSLTRGIERRLEESLGYEVAACLRTIPELESVLTADPFKSLEVAQTMRLCVAFGEAFDDPQTYQGAVPGDDYLRSLLGKPCFIALAALDPDKAVGGLAAYVLEEFEQDRQEVYITDMGGPGAPRSLAQGAAGVYALTGTETRLGSRKPFQDA